MCQFHWVDYDGASLTSRFYYGAGSWENFGGDDKVKDENGKDVVVASRVGHGMSLIGTKESGVNTAMQTLTINRVVSAPAEDTDYNQVHFGLYQNGVLSDISVNNQKGTSKQKTFYNTAQLNNAAAGYDANHAFFALPSIVYAIRMYDRTLTEAEMKQNHAVDLMAYFRLDVEGFAEASELAKAVVYDVFADFSFDASTGEVVMMQKAIDRASSGAPVGGLGFQVSTDGKDLRILGALDYTENISRVGFVITFKQNGEVVKTFGAASADNTATTTKTVFSSVTSDGVPYSADVLCAEYLYAAVVKGVPAGTYTVEVTPFFVDMAENVVKGETKSQTVTF
jgi:hypothetical protein